MYQCPECSHISPVEGDCPNCKILMEEMTDNTELGMEGGDEEIA